MCIRDRLGGVKASPLSDLIYEGIDLARREKVDFVLALGGGSVMDSAKGIALGAVYDGDFWDFYCGKKGPVTEALPDVYKRQPFKVQN